MPAKSETVRELLFQVEQLYRDLGDIIAKDRWGGGKAYVSLYNHLLEQARQIIPALSLPDAKPPRRFTLAEDPNAYSLQFLADRVAILDLFPLCGQLLAWLEEEVKR